MRVLARRTLSGLVPADEQAQAELLRVPVGKLVQVEIKAARNPRQHRLLFAMLKLMVDHAEFPSIRAALNALKIATGHVESIIVDRDGSTQIIPASISYASMRGTEFSAWFDSAIQVIIARWLPGMSSEELKREIEEMVS